MKEYTTQPSKRDGAGSVLTGMCRCCMPRKIAAKRFFKKQVHHRLRRRMHQEEESLRHMDLKEEKFLDAQWDETHSRNPQDFSAEEEAYWDEVFADMTVYDERGDEWWVRERDLENPADDGD